MFVIVGKGDVPMYETMFSRKEESQSIVITHYFTLHSSLDIVDEKILTNTQKDFEMFMRKVDKSSKNDIYCFVTATNIKFLLLIAETTKEENVLAFFLEVQEHLNRQLMNPLYILNSPITSARFDVSVRTSAARLLNQPL